MSRHPGDGWSRSSAFWSVSPTWRSFRPSWFRGSTVRDSSTQGLPGALSTSWAILKRVEADEGQYDDARDVFWVSGAAFCCRADVFRALGGFDDDFFAHMEEIDLCWRMQLAGYRVRVVPGSTVYHLGGGTLTTDSPTKVFYNHRNNLAMLYKCASPVQRAVVAVVRPVLDLMAALSYLAQGRGDNFRAVFRAWRDFLRWHGSLSRKRKEIRQQCRGTVAGKVYRGSVVLRYLLGRKTFGRMM